MNNTRPDIPEGVVKNKHGKILTFRRTSGYWSERTYTEDGHMLTYNNSDGHWEEHFYDLGVYVTENMSVHRLL